MEIKQLHILFIKFHFGGSFLFIKTFTSVFFILDYEANFMPILLILLKKNRKKIRTTV